MEIHLVRTSLGLQAYGDEDYEMLRSSNRTFMELK